MLCAEDLKRHERLLKRQRAIWAYKQIAISLILALFRRTIWVLTCFRDLLSISFSRIGVMAHALGLSLKEVVQQTRPQVLVRLNFEETVLDGAGTRHDQLQDRIRVLDGQLWNRKADARSRVAPNGRRLGETREVCSPIPSRNSGAIRAFARLPSLVEGRVLASVVGVITVTLVAAGAVRATIPSLPGEAPVPVASKMPSSTRPAAALPGGVSTGPPKILKPASSPTSAPGFSILVTKAVSESLPLSGVNIASMMLMTSPLAMAPTELHATPPAHAVAAPRAVKPKLKAKPKLATQEPQEQLPWLRPPWWRRFSWIRIP
jgi:hypothetical protein